MRYLKKLLNMMTAKKSLIVFMLGCLATVSASAQLVEPNPPGWVAGEVASSPLKPVWGEGEFKTLKQAQKAKDEALQELERTEKIRRIQRTLCDRKFFVNSCINRVEAVLHDREAYAGLLRRKADSAILAFKWQERQAKPAAKPAMPVKRADAQAVSNEQLQAAGLSQSERDRQELANQLEFEQRKAKARERQEKLKKEAAEREARRAERRQVYEAKLQEQRAAQQKQRELEAEKGLF